jgi:hypothetical protein
MALPPASRLPSMHAVVARISISENVEQRRAKFVKAAVCSSCVA